MSDSPGFLSNTAAQAEAMLEQQGFYQEAPKADTPAVVPASSETPAAVEAVAPTSQDTPVVEPVAQAAVIQPLDVSPDTPIKIKVNGEEKIVKASEYQEMLQRTDVFTQRQQGLAKQARDLETYYAQKEAYLTQQAQAIEGLMQQFGQRQAPQAQQPTAPTPNLNEVATLGEVQQAMVALAQQFQQVRAQDQQAVAQTLEQRAQQAREDFEIAQDQKRFTSAVRQVLDSPEGKLLAEINPKAEQILRFRPLEMGATSTDQAIEFLNQFAKEWAGTVQGRLSAQQTAKAVTAAKTVMEAPLGSAPPVQTAPSKVALKKDGSIDWDALRARSMAIMESL